jgi:putative flippase GtrA
VTGTPAPIPSRLRRLGLQFVKFSIVGVGSTLIDVGLHFLLVFGVPVGGEPLGAVVGRALIGALPALFAFADEPVKAAVPVFKVISATAAILNSFYWNRRWTFRILDPADRLAQLRRFVIVSVVGMLLSTAIVTTGTALLPGSTARNLAIASAVATGVVAVWNFAGQRLWAFRPRG